MYAWTMLIEFNCQSATHVKNAVVFHYIHTLFHTLFNACHVCIWPCFIRFCFAEIALPELLKEPPCSQFSSFLRDLLARRNLCTAASRASGIGLIMMKHKEQFSVSAVYLCVYSYILNTLHDLI